MEPNNNNNNYAAMANCVFPVDMLICIMARVPVISIVRFKSVCKSWFHLFSTPWFIKMHQGPTHQHFVVQKMEMDTITLLNALNKKHTTLDHPIKPPPYCSIRIVGCCNGLFCITRGPVIALWNPATNLSKQISPSGFLVHNRASLGFGYDSEGSDFKVVRLVLEEPRQGGERVIGVEVYSVLSDSWTTLSHDIMGYPFSVSWRKGRNDVIVNGNPYWHAKVIDGIEFLLGFNVNELLFNVLPVFDHEAAEFMFDYNGRLGALVCKVPEGRKLVESLDVWVFDDVACIWREDRTYTGVINKACVDRVLQFSKSGMVLGVRSIGRVCAFSPEAGRDKKFKYAVQRGQLVEVFGYTESLAYVRGMEQVKLVSGRHFGRDWLL